MLGALCCGLAYRYTSRLLPTYVAEIAGTGILGGMMAYPVATWLLGKDAALFTYVIPFLVSTCGGTLMAAVLTAVLYRTHALRELQKVLQG
jgi:energy coupling factor transporter S component ThiW